jgi:hypothetical protein
MAMIVGADPVKLVRALYMLAADQTTPCSCLGMRSETGYGVK